jgi:hypothetical protein
MKNIILGLLNGIFVWSCAYAYLLLLPLTNEQRIIIALISSVMAIIIHTVLTMDKQTQVMNRKVG